MEGRITGWMEHRPGLEQVDPAWSGRSGGVLNLRGSSEQRVTPGTCDAAPGASGSRIHRRDVEVSRTQPVQRHIAPVGGRVLAFPRGIVRRFRPVAPASHRPWPRVTTTMLHRCCLVSVPEQGGFQACRVPQIWFTPPSSAGTPGMPVPAARTGYLSAVPGALTPGTADKSGRRPGPGRSPAGPGCPVRA